MRSSKNKNKHPGRLTWNIVIGVWKIMFLSKWVICRFHVNLPGWNTWLPWVPDFFLERYLKPVKSKSNYRVNKPNNRGHPGHSRPRWITFDGSLSCLRKSRESTPKMTFHVFGAWWKWWNWTILIKKKRVQCLNSWRIKCFLGALTSLTLSSKQPLWSSDDFGVVKRVSSRAAHCELPATFHWGNSETFHSTRKMIGRFP